MTGTYSNTWIQLFAPDRMSKITATTKDCILWLIMHGWASVANLFFTVLLVFVLWLPVRIFYGEKADFEGKAFTLASSSMMLCCSRTWSFRKATSCSSCAWSRSFKDFSFFSGGWELIFSFCNTPIEKSDHNISRWSKKQKDMWCERISVPTISRFSFARPLSFSSIFWIVWVNSSFLLFSSLFLSSRGLHCFSDSRTRFSWWGGEETLSLTWKQSI